MEKIRGQKCFAAIHPCTFVQASPKSPQAKKRASTIVTRAITADRHGKLNKGNKDTCP